MRKKDEGYPPLVEHSHDQLTRCNRSDISGVRGVLEGDAGRVFGNFDGCRGMLTRRRLAARQIRRLPPTVNDNPQADMSRGTNVISEVLSPVIRYSSDSRSTGRDFPADRGVPQRISIAATSVRSHRTFAGFRCRRRLSSRFWAGGATRVGDYGCAGEQKQRIAQPRGAGTGRFSSSMAHLCRRSSVASDPISGQAGWGGARSWAATPRPRPFGK
jgi:hypothetical protein